MKPEIDLAAQRQINYLDFWQRLAADNVKNKLFKDIVNPIWEGFYVWGHGWPGWPERYGQFKNSTEVYAPIREIYGPVGEYYGDNGAMAGAYAAIYDNPYDNRAKVTFVMSNMVVVKEQMLKPMPKECCNHQLLKVTKVNTVP